MDVARCVLLFSTLSGCRHPMCGTDTERSNPSARAKHMVLRLSKQGSYQVLFRAHEASPRLANEVCDSKKSP